MRRHAEYRVPGKEGNRNPNHSRLPPPPQSAAAGKVTNHLGGPNKRKFSKVMRGALALVRGRVPEDMGEQLQRRRELLGLYRWTGDGTGLAL